MNSRRPDKFVSASGPVNRRTAQRQPLPREQVAPAVFARLQQRQARSRLGGSLAEQLRARPAAQAGAPLDRGTVAGGVLAAGSGVGLLLGWLQAAPLLVTAGAGGLAVGAMVVLWRLRRRGAHMALEARAEPVFEPASLAALDAALDAVADEVPGDIAAQLAAIKQLVVRIGRQRIAADEHFTLDDRLYVVESVRRYLPDSLQGYLRVPAAQRQVVLPGADASAQALLANQLALLQDELARREAKLARSAAEALLAQQRFLKSKSG